MGSEQMFNDEQVKLWSRRHGRDDRGVPEIRDAMIDAATLDTSPLVRLRTQNANLRARITALETRLKAERAEVDAWREHDVCGNVKCRVKNCQLSVLMDQTDAARKECPL